VASAPALRQTRPHPKSKTVPDDKPLTKAEKLERRHRRLPLAELRPKTRGDCKDGPRPCPWISCRYHLAGEVTPAGSLKLLHPGREIWELEETCALDVAERGGTTLERIGQLVNITMERVRQEEEEALHGIGVAIRLGYGVGFKRLGAKLAEPRTWETPETDDETQAEPGG
jgi:hypothetical protein